MNSNNSSIPVYHKLGVVDVVGIDVSKAKLDVCLIQLDQTRSTCSVPNTPTGFTQLHAWITKKLGSETVYCVCLESTGSYGEGVAKHFVAKGVAVSMVNPSQTKSFSTMQLRRSKTDRTDAEGIASFARVMLLEGTLPRYEPRSKEEEKLQDMVRHREALVHQRDQMSNRLEASVCKVVERSINTVVQSLNRQIARMEAEIKQLMQECKALGEQQELLQSIPGVGDVGSSTLLAEAPLVERFASAKQFAAFIGVTPHLKHSGDHQPVSQPISKIGNRRLRSVLYMCALSAMRFNPHLRAMAERLYAKGKASKQVIVAVMRKLTHLMFAILKSRKRYDPNYKNIQLAVN